MLKAGKRSKPLARALESLLDLSRRIPSPKYQRQVANQANNIGKEAKNELDPARIKALEERVEGQMRLIRDKWKMKLLPLPHEGVHVVEDPERLQTQNVRRDHSYDFRYKRLQAQNWELNRQVALMSNTLRRNTELLSQILDQIHNHGGGPSPLQLPHVPPDQLPSKGKRARERSGRARPCAAVAEPSQEVKKWYSEVVVGQSDDEEEEEESSQGASAQAQKGGKGPPKGRRAAAKPRPDTTQDIARKPTKQMAPVSDFDIDFQHDNDRINPDDDDDNNGADAYDDDDVDDDDDDDDARPAMYVLSTEKHAALSIEKHDAPSIEKHAAAPAEKKMFQLSHLGALRKQCTAKDLEFVYLELIASGTNGLSKQEWASKTLDALIAKGVFVPELRVSIGLHQKVRKHIGCTKDYLSDRSVVYRMVNGQEK